jgi:hypothetical protein
MILKRVTWSAAILLWSAVFCFAAQSPQEANGARAAAEMSFTYRFENPRFHLRKIEIDLSGDGKGDLRFMRGESDEILDCKVKLLPPTITRIRSLFQSTDFLDSKAEYQDKTDMSHLGWITLAAKKGARERSVRFNYTINPQIKELADIFRGIATQEISLFDIDNAQRYQPLDLPKQLETLERDLRLEWIAEPERVLVVLDEMGADDTQPLIARNHAKRIAEAIKKGKYKSPMKK